MKKSKGMNPRKRIRLDESVHCNYITRKELDDALHDALNHKRRR